MPRTCAGTNRNQLNKTKKREAVEREVRALESAVRAELWPLVLLPDLPDGAASADPHSELPPWPRLAGTRASLLITRVACLHRQPAVRVIRRAFSFPKF